MEHTAGPAAPAWPWITDLGPGLLPLIDEKQLEALADQLARLPNATLARVLPAHFDPDDSTIAAYKIIAQRWNRGGPDAAKAAVRVPVLASSLSHLAYICGYWAKESGEISDGDRALLSELAGSLRHIEKRLRDVRVPPELDADPWAQPGLQAGDDSRPDWIKRHHKAYVPVVDLAALNALLAKADDRPAIFDAIVKVFTAWSNHVELGDRHPGAQSRLAFSKGLAALQRAIAAQVEVSSRPVRRVLWEVSFGCRYLLHALARAAEYEGQSAADEESGLMPAPSSEAGSRSASSHGWPAWMTAAESEAGLPKVNLSVARSEFLAFARRQSAGVSEELKRARRILEALQAYDEIAAVVISGADCDDDLAVAQNVAATLEHQARELDAKSPTNRYKYAPEDYAELVSLSAACGVLATAIRAVVMTAREDPYQSTIPSVANAPSWIEYGPFHIFTVRAHELDRRLHHLPDTGLADLVRSTLAYSGQGASTQELAMLRVALNDIAAHVQNDAERAVLWELAFGVRHVEQHAAMFATHATASSESSSSDSEGTESSSSEESTTDDWIIAGYEPAG